MVELTREECLAILFAEDPPPPRLDSFALCHDSERRGFLEALIMHGEQALFAATAHVWASLMPPRAWHCIAIGKAAGTGGYGKHAIFLALQAFIEADYKFAERIAPLPDVDQFRTRSDWHEAVSAGFASDWAVHQALLARHADILDGRPPAPRKQGVVVKGPWRKRPASRRGLPPAG